MRHPLCGPQAARTAQRFQMMNKFLNFALLSLAVSLSACDEGRIPEKEAVLDAEGRAAKVTAQITGTESWPADYIVAFAAFAENNDYALYVKDASTAKNADGTYSFHGIPDGVKTLELCAVNKLRRRIVSFAQMDISQISDSIFFDAGSVNVGMFNAIQDNIFTRRCATCHGGGSGTAAAHLPLGAGLSYQNLVNTPSTVLEGRTRVVPGKASESLLYDVLTTSITADWSYTHSNLMSSDDDIYNLQLIRDWINNGASE